LTGTMRQTARSGSTIDAPGVSKLEIVTRSVADTVPSAGTTRWARQRPGRIRTFPKRRIHKHIMILHIDTIIYVQTTIKNTG
jgi:hypothetical protein